MRARMRVLGLALFLPIVVGGVAAADEVLVPLDVRQVEVGGEMGRRIDVTVRHNLLAFDFDEVFLAPFLDRQDKVVYIGLGKCIDALSRLAAYTQDEKLLALREHVLEETLASQEPDGYIGLFTPPNRVHKLWDIHEMSYLIYGLCTDAQLFGNERAKAAAVKLGDYIVDKLEAQPGRRPINFGIKLNVAVTGIEGAMLRLAETTGNAKYRDFVVNYRKLLEWQDPIELGRTADIANHAYSYVCRCLAQLRLYRAMPDDRLLARSRDVMQFLTHGNGLVITGNCGDHECWHNTQSGTVNLGETCLAPYLIRWWAEQMCMTGDVSYGDLMERTIYNALFAAQSPDGRHIRYYTPFDGPRAYFPKDSYCCPNNYRRGISELPTYVYYRSGDGVLVNLYTPSSATIVLGGHRTVKLRQETDYPSSGRVVVHVDPGEPVDFAMRLRVPRWCERASATVRAADTAETFTTFGGQLLSIRRAWKAGDRIELDMPMKLRLARGRINQAGRVAVMYGPTLFCLNPANNAAAQGMDVRLLAVHPPTLRGPFRDDSVRPNGLACTIDAWPPGAWYPAGEPSVELKLTEFTDPGGVATYFFTPDPNDPHFVDDELLTP